MKNLFKNNLRYIYKNKLITVAITILLTIAVMVFAAFSHLAYVVNTTYKQMINNYDLHDIVINENYSQDKEQANKQKQNLQNELKKLGISYQDFKSINVNNTTKQELAKVIEYYANSEINRINVFQQYGLPQNTKYGNYVLPNSIDFESILNLAQANLDNGATKENILARQKIVYFMSKADFKVEKIKNNVQQAFNYIVEQAKLNPSQLFDPINSTNGTTETKDVAQYLRTLLDPASNNYSPIEIRGHKIIINLASFNNNIPASGYFQDPYSYLAIISNGYFDNNQKAVYSYTQFNKDILINANTYQQESNLDFFTAENPAMFKDIKSTENIANWIDKLDDKYKVYVGNIPYLIVGTGITPDFIYPVISFENPIPDPNKEVILYANHNGYERTEQSFASSPHESFLVAKLKDNIRSNQILKKINDLAKENMNWPSNITPVYWYNDLDNQLSPSGLRIGFINTIITTFVLLIIFLTLFVLAIALFVMTLFVKRYMAQNKGNIATMISNGINKYQVMFSIAVVISSVSIIAAPIGVFLANFLQSSVFTFLDSYWFLPTPLVSFAPWWYFVITLTAITVFTIIIFGIGFVFLNEPVVEMLKNKLNLKINFFYLGFRKLFANRNVMFKFKSSLIFNSFTKIFFITLLSTLSIGAITFSGSSNSKIYNTFVLERETNASQYAIDLFTPTSQGGQYYGVPLNEIGRRQKGAISNNNNLLEINPDSSYNYLFNKTPIFQAYNSFLWASASDQTKQKENINYTKNVSAIEMLLNHEFGVDLGVLGKFSTNPWNLTKAFLPSNQAYTSNNMTIQLMSKMLSDNRPINQAYFDSFEIASGDKRLTNFPSKWVIQNFNMQTDFDNWALNYNHDPNVGVINASEIFNQNKTLKWLTPEAVLKDKDNLATIINNAYKTYDANNPGEIPVNLSERLYPKYYGKHKGGSFWKPTYQDNLFDQKAISNVRIENDVVLFDVDTAQNTLNNIITNRSWFLNEFLTKQDVPTNTDNLSGFLFDPLDQESFINKKYYYVTNENVLNKYSISEILVLPNSKLSNDFVKMMLKTYNDPAYKNSFYRISNNQIVLDPDTDEPYVYVEGLYKNKENIKITGIMQDSKFISLYDLKKNKINHKLFVNDPNSNNVVPIIINRYAAKKYNLNLGDQFKVKTVNETTRYNYKDKNVIKDILNGNNNVNVEYQDGKEQIYKIVDINNTGNDSQFYISMNNAQKILGLATTNDYINNHNITTITNNVLTVGMNNQLNAFGGFNGIYTSNFNPYAASITVSLYSPHGLYPGVDSWSESNEIINLIKHTLNNKYNNFLNLANALDLTYDELNGLKTQHASNLDAFATNIIKLLSNKYDVMAFNTIFENATSLAQQENIFKNMSVTFDSIMMSVIVLLICLSIIIIMLVANMVIEDLAKLTTILKVLGCDDKKSASMFFSIFSVAWLCSVGLAIPLSFGLMTLFINFIFNTFAILLILPFNWIVFSVIIFIFALIFGGIFFWGLKWFKKNNILNALKW